MYIGRAGLGWTSDPTRLDPKNIGPDMKFRSDGPSSEIRLNNPSV